MSNSSSSARPVIERMMDEVLSSSRSVGSVSGTNWSTKAEAREDLERRETLEMTDFVSSCWSGSSNICAMQSDGFDPTAESNPRER